MGSRAINVNRMTTPTYSRLLAGWDQVRSRLLGIDGKPALYEHANCTNLIRTLPALQHDSLKVEDVDSDVEDHAVDALRYGCVSRPWKSAAAGRQRVSRTL